MHPYVFIPLSATLIGTAITAANVARAPRHHATRGSAAILAVTSLWGLVDFMMVTSADAEAAGTWVRFVPVLALLLGPLCLLLLAKIKPAVAVSLRRLAWVGGVASLPLVAVILATDQVVAGVVPSATSIWRIDPGPLFPWLLLQALTLPLVTLVLVMHSADRGPERGAAGSDRLLGAVIAVPLTITFVSEALLPMLDIDSPRVGVLSLAVLGGATWLYYFSGFDGAVSEAGMARRILERLPSGVALIETDGRLRAVNAPLARWLGRSREDLIGLSISSFMLMPLPEMLSLDQERETELLPEGSEPIPTAIGVAPIHDRQGGAVGFVVSCRDLREQAALKSHLDTAQQMATVGEMAAGIAHEVNNPVAYIQANLNLLRRHYAELSEMLASDDLTPTCTPEFIDSGADCVEEALSGLARISGIVREVRAFAHAGQGERQLADVNALLESALQLAALHRGSSDLIERRLANLPRIEIGGQELKQALFGVAQWAFATGEPGTRFEVSTSVVGECVEVVFRVRTASPGHTGEAAGRTSSRGIQLVIARQILDEEGGDLRIEAEPTGIMCVRVSLPIEPANNGHELDCDPSEPRADGSLPDVDGPMEDERIGDTS